jgi:YHS domain-containing protein
MRGYSRLEVIRGFALVAASAVVSMVPGPLRGQESVLAIRGYDPVAYFTIGNPVRGRSDIAFEWDELRYLFSSPEHRELFRADPVRYAPQFANFCAMALTKGQLDEADPENWLISDGKLYIFAKAAPFGPALFQQDLSGNIARANQHRSLIKQR